jgi:hypothetical protein
MKKFFKVQKTASFQRRKTLKFAAKFPYENKDLANKDIFEMFTRDHKICESE